MTELHAGLGGAVRPPRRVYAVLICHRPASGWLAAASIAMGWPAFGLLLFFELSLRAEAARAARRARPAARRARA